MTSTEKTEKIGKETRYGGEKMYRAIICDDEETVRNGQRIAYDGDIVVCGDVNFGGELVATGSIAVMGALRGVAHAGSAGDETAIVTAYRLQPQQLRIGAQIAIAPDGEQEEVGYPEIASVFQGAITIRPASRVIRKQQ